MSAQPPATLREQVKALHGQFFQGLDENLASGHLLTKFSGAIDRLVIDLWLSSLRQQRTLCALVAVGGYGRGKLHPFSDIDLLVIVPSKQNTVLLESVSCFIGKLWDLGMEVGHAVRTVNQCVTLCRDEITVMTNILESRLLAGSSALLAQLQHQTSIAHIWPPEAFCQAKIDELTARHNAHNASGYRLEPNIKEGPGGLRDIQTLVWVAKRINGAHNIEVLHQRGYLSEDEFAELIRGREHLWRLRALLHQLAGRKEDRLLLHHQQELAQRAGFNGRGNAGVEAFMHQHYRTVIAVQRLTHLLLQVLRESQQTLLPLRKPLSEHFHQSGDALCVNEARIFSEQPETMLEVFVLAAEHPEIHHISAPTIRALTQNLHLINDEFRASPKARHLFMSILRATSGITRQLRRMHRYGVLAAYWPAFAAVSGRMQFDLFHIYTVDEHTLRVMHYLRRLMLPKHASELPLAHEIAKKVKKPELLYLMALLHDIAKGRGGDHSELGAIDAAQFCQQHYLDEKDCQLVAWGVRHHLLMSVTAQKKDISDPAVVEQFANIAGDQERLDHLYLLTLADIRGTNPEIWTSWKAHLLSALYHRTTEHLDQAASHNTTHNDVAQTHRRKAYEASIHVGIDAQQLTALWHGLPDEYFARYPIDELVWHAQVRMAQAPNNGLVVSLANLPKRGVTTLFIAGHDEDFLFTHITSALARVGVNIIGARIMTSDHGCALDSFTLTGPDNQPLLEESMPLLQQRIHAALIQKNPPEPIQSRTAKQRKAAVFGIVPNIDIADDLASGLTEIHITAADRPGILADIGQVFEACAIRLHRAYVTTLGERIEDAFIISDRNNCALQSDSLRTRLTTQLKRKLHEHNDAP